MHPDAEADPDRYPLIVTGGSQDGCADAEQAELQANDDAVPAPDRQVALAGRRTA